MKKYEKKKKMLCGSFITNQKVEIVSTQKWKKARYISIYNLICQEQIDLKKLNS